MAKIKKISRTFRLNPKTISFIKDMAYVFEMSEADVISYCVSVIHEDLSDFESDDCFLILTEEELSRAVDLFLPFDVKK